MIKSFEVAPSDVQKDIDYIYNIVINKNGRRSGNYIKDKMLEPVVGVTIRYDDKGNPVSTARMLSRSCYKDSVRVFDRYGLIEGSTGLIPNDYDGLFKKSSSEMLEQQTNFCLDRGYKCVFISMELRVEKTLKRVSKGGLQYIGYTGNKFERNDKIYYTRLEN
jgi:hypothetical protein